MSRHRHHHTAPLGPPPGPSHHLPRDTYGALVGVVDGPLSDADDNHVFIPLRVRAGDLAGRYRVAVNVESDDRSASTGYFVRDEAISAGDLPPDGFDPGATLSYAAIGLRESDFRPIRGGLLRTVVHSTVEVSTAVAVYGVTFGDGAGMHDVHMRSGEDPASHHGDHPGRDGALACYFQTRGGEHVRRWMFIKFSSQRLP